MHALRSRKGVALVLGLVVAVIAAIMSVGAVARAEATISGIVTSQGQPVEEAHVVLYRDDGAGGWEWASFVDTGFDANAGEFEFIVPDDGHKYHVSASKEGYEDRYYQGADHLEDGTDVTPGEELAIDIVPARSIDGKVTQNGNNSRHAEVRLFADNKGTWEWVNTAFTKGGARKGTFSIDVPRGDEEYKIRVNKTGWQTEWYDDARTLEDAAEVGVTDDVRVDLGKASRIRGMVTQNGRPAKRVRVNLWDEEAGQWDNTLTRRTKGGDNAGEYSIPVPDEARKYIVEFDKDGWKNEYYNDTRDLDAADRIGPGRGIDADLESWAKLKGKVTLDGRAAAGIRVEAFGEGDEVTPWAATGKAVTRANGRYMIRTDIGVRKVRFSKLGWSTGFAGGGSHLRDDDSDFISVEDGAGSDAEQFHADGDLQPGAEGRSLKGALDPDDLANKIAGNGIMVRGASYTGRNRAAGDFAAFAQLDFNRGIGLSTGRYLDVFKPNLDEEINTDNEQPGDPDVDAIIDTHDSRDASALEVRFIPATDSISVDYRFGSEEYVEYVGSHNDAFVLDVNGQHCGLVPGTGTPVTVDSVNPDSNADLYNDNDEGPLSRANTALDGWTDVLTCTASVTAGEVNTMKVAIGDAFDHAIDSAVFIPKSGLTSE